MLSKKGNDKKLAFGIIFYALSFRVLLSFRPPKTKKELGSYFSY